MAQTASGQLASGWRDDMALQTVTFSQSNNGYTLDLILTEESTSIADNTSHISFRLQLRSGNSNRFSNYRVAAHVTLNGAVVASREMDWGNQISLGFNSSIVILSGECTIAHGDDGTKTLPVAFGITTAVESYSPGVISVADKSMALTDIARASSITGTAANIGSTSIIVISRKANLFTHSVGITFGAIKGYLDADGNVVGTERRLDQTTIPFRVPESFYQQIPEAPSGVCRLTCKTYSGDLQIGAEQSGEFTVTADASVCSPSVSGAVVDINEKTVELTGDANRLIKHASTARCVMTATPKNAAYIKEKKIAGVALAANENILDILNVELPSISFYAKDSRGYPGEFSPPVEMVPYVKLTSNPSIRRTDPTSGRAQLIVNGNYFRGNFGARDNSLTIQYRVGTGDVVDVPSVIGDNNDYSAEIIIPGLEYTQSHNIEVTVSDALTTVTKTVTVGKGVPVFDWGENDFSFNVPVNFNAPVSFPSANSLVATALRFDTNTTVLVPAVSRGIGMVAVMNNAHQMALYLVCNYESNTQEATAVSIVQRIAGDGELSFEMKNGQLEITCQTQWSYGWYIRNT